MSNEIDLVVGNQAFTQITRLLTELGKVDTSFTELSAKFAALGNNTNTIKSTADLAKLTAENAKLNAVIEQQIKDFSDLNAKLAQANIARTTSTKGVTEATIAQRELNAQTTLNIKATTDAVGAYAKLDAQHKLAVKTAQDLAVATGRTGQSYEDAKNKANELGNRLRVIDTDIGKHTRNVGNYSSSWNGLGNSINQLTREAPAFANSVQTGFMALSNNIPILTDEIGVLINKNKELQAEGKPTQSILKTVAGAFFSWQTAISLGVTILTVYGAKLYEMFVAFTKGKEGINELKKSTEDLNKAFEDTSVKNAVENVNELKINIGLAKQGFLDKEAVVKQYNETIGTTTGLVSNLDEAEQGLVKNADAYIKMTLYKAAAQLALEEAAKASLEAERTRVKDLKDFSNAFLDADLTQTRSKEQYDQKQKNLQTQLKLRKEEEIKISENASKANLNIAKKFQEDAAKIAKDFDFNLFGDTKKENDKKVKQEKAKKEDLDHLESYIKPVGTIIDEINKEIDRLTTEKIIADEYELPIVNQQLEAMIKLRTELNELPKGGALPDNFVKPEQIEGLKQLTQEMKNYLQSFVSEFASKSNFEGVLYLFEGEDSLFERMKTGMAFTKDSWKSDTVAMMEAAQEMYNFIDSTSQANFDKEYARLDAQKEASLKFAGDSTSAKEKIEADYQKKKKEIEAREFKQKQKSAVVNIAIDTAQAILATFAKTPPPAGIPLAAAIGVLGAIQAGVVLSQKPPAYADGTDNHSGGLMLVNDGAGSNFQEKVILPSGKVIRPQGRNVLMDAPKGTKVLNHEQQLFEMLQSNNISMSTQGNSGMTSEEMDEILGKHFGNIKTQNTIFDKNGFQTYVRNGNSITRSNSNRSQAIGISV
jgi:hypothetical protein